MSFKNEQSIIELWDKFKQPNIRVVGVCKKRRVTEKKYLNKSWLEVSKFVENDKTMDRSYGFHLYSVVLGSI